MTMVIVDPLEMIEIEQQKRECALMPFPARPLHHELRVECAAIRQSGQPIALGQGAHFPELTRLFQLNRGVRSDGFQCGDGFLTYAIRTRTPESQCADDR